MENSFNNIYYVLIGDLVTKNILFEQPMTKSTTPTSAKDIFHRMAVLKNTNSNIIRQKNKIPSNESYSKSFYYFYITENFIFIFIEASEKLPSNAAFKFIDHLIQDNVHFMNNDQGELNLHGKHKIKTLLTKFNETVFNGGSNNGLEEIQLNIKETARQNTHDGMIGENKPFRMGENSPGGTKRIISDKKCCKGNLKMILIICGIVIILLVVIILPIVLSQLYVPKAS
jgi:hypothetical protein